MTHIPGRLFVDKRVPERETIRGALSGASPGTVPDGADLELLRRVLYPVYRVEYAYEVDGGLLSGAEETTDTILIDGLWAENEQALAQYATTGPELQRVPSEEYDFGGADPGLGPTTLFEFQVGAERAEAVLPDRVAEYEAERQSSGSPDVFTRMVRDRYGLADDFEPENFQGVRDVQWLYLPFWVAEFRADSEQLAVLTVRSDEYDETELRRHAWLAEFISEDPRRMAEYGYEVDLERLQRYRRSDESGGSDGQGRPDEEGRPDDGGTGQDRPHGSAGPASDGPATTDDVVQPDGVDLTADTLVEPRPDRTFADVGGMEDLLETLQHTVVRPLEDPEAFERYGLGVVDGVLLHGPPGCGKTYVAGALAGEVNLPFISVTPADVTSKYMGEPAKNVADLFAIARANAPCVLFIDEIDGIGGARDGAGDMNSSEQQMVNQLLSELEDAQDDDVVVVGATNLIEDVDPAIRRSGRFDERVEVPPPDAAARREILELHLAGRPTAEDLAVDSVVEATAGFAASDVELLAETAARAALREDAPIGTDHLVAAADEVDSSIAGWVDPAGVEAGEVIQPDGVDLRARNLIEPSPDRDFSDVGGLSDLKERLRETVLEPLAKPEEYESYGLDVLSGLLLYGPPGCGKTHLAGALAGEVDRSFLPVTPSAITSKWMGKPAQNVADLFTIARANAPCVLFIDELDAIGGARAGGMNASERQMVNQLLTELESTDEDVVVVGATNLIEDVDGALRRSGRFDERIEVPPPDAAARQAILEIHLADRPVDQEAIEWDPIVEATEGYAGSDLALLVENAARSALAADTPVTQAHLEAAVDETESSIEGWLESGEYAVDAEEASSRPGFYQ